MIDHLRRTKIVATLGPTSSDREMIFKMTEAGVNVYRLNFSHGSHEDHKKRAELVRESSKKFGHEVAIMADLQGPKIRIARFKNKKVFLKENDEFILDAELEKEAGDESMVGIDYKELPQDVASGDVLLLDDGRVVLSVKDVQGFKIICQVVVGGELSNNKGINRQGGGLSAKALTDKDKDDLKFAVTLDVDYFAISFPRCAEDMEEAKRLIKAEGSGAGVIAKIERVEAVAAVDEIIKASDGVMVARGDLGVEIGDAELPGVQKHIIQRARALNKPAITATQMMETMIHNVIPTRAEVFDVANAVLDNTDAVMLSAETASGDHPHIVVATMARVCRGAEKQPETQVSKHRVECRFEKVDEAIAMAAMYIANHEDIKALVCLTESGSTPLLMSRIRSAIPIYAMTRNIATQRKMHLYRSVYPMAFDVMARPLADIDHDAVAVLKDRSIVEEGDMVLITKGDVVGEHGHTNIVKIHKVDTI